MNSVQLHLALTHVPVIVSFVGLIMLIVAFFLKNTIFTKTSYILLLIAGITAVPVFLTGEGTEEAIENLPGISEGLIEEHEEMANLALIAISASGLSALTALFAFRWQGATRALKFVVLVLAITSGGLMAQTAHLGGQIRHTEIGNASSFQNDSQQQEDSD